MADDRCSPGRASIHSSRGPATSTAAPSDEAFVRGHGDDTPTVGRKRSRECSTAFHPWPGRPHDRDQGGPGLTSSARASAAVALTTSIRSRLRRIEAVLGLEQIVDRPASERREAPEAIGRKAARRVTRLLVGQPSRSTSRTSSSSSRASAAPCRAAATVAVRAPCPRWKPGAPGRRQPVRVLRSRSTRRCERRSPPNGPGTGARRRLPERVEAARSVERLTPKRDASSRSAHQPFPSGGVPAAISQTPVAQRAARGPSVDMPAGRSCLRRLQRGRDSGRPGLRPQMMSGP